jgi:undecaprenyl diphosphate synthase
MSSPRQDPAADRLPRHIAIVMDGNGRWARSKGLPRAAGHRAGVKTARATVEACGERGIMALTLFAFSTENWRRPPSEVGALMKLMIEALDREVEELARRGVRLRFIGAREQLSDTIIQRMEHAEAHTSSNDKLDLVSALAYGGRWDIAQAARRLASRVRAGDLDPEDIDEAMLDSQLSLDGLPDPDLLIRTGGESRISNFLLWNLAYSELFFTDRLWPDFSGDDLDRALAFYSGRERRFGQVPGQARRA